MLDTLNFQQRGCLLVFTNLILVGTCICTYILSLQLRINDTPSLNISKYRWWKGLGTLSLFDTITTSLPQYLQDSYRDG